MWKRLGFVIPLLAALWVLSISAPGSSITKGTGTVFPVTTQTADYGAASGDYTILVDTTSGNVTVTLEASPATGQVHVIKKLVVVNSLVISGNGHNVESPDNETLGASITVTTKGASYMLQFDGTQWWVI